MKIYFKILMTLGASFVSYYTTAQQLSAYNNYKRQFIIQDGYSEFVAEGVEAQDYQVGKTLIAYNDVSQQFKVYQNGVVVKPTKMLINEYKVSDNLLTMVGGAVLRVYDNGVTTVLASRVGFYESKDSVVLFSDVINQKLYVYYSGQKIELESVLAGNQMNGFSVGDNIVAYNNYLNQFKIFYQGETQILDNYAATEITAARDIVAFKDANSVFKVFYKGEIYVLDEFNPSAFWVGDRFVAFQASDGNFKLFYDGKIKDIGYFTPKVVGVQDFLMWYQDFNGYFKLFYQGDFFTPDLVMPTDMMAKYKSLAFMDRFKHLQYFRDGQIYAVTSLPVKDLELDYETLKYVLGINSVKIYGSEPLN